MALLRQCLFEVRAAAEARARQTPMQAPRGAAWPSPPAPVRAGSPWEGSAPLVAAPQRRESRQA